MKRGPATPPSEEVRLYRRAVTRLKREIGKVDSNARRRYIREFQAEFGSYQDIASFDDLLVDCLKADLIYIGDYHALPASQRFAARLLGEVASRSRQVALGMEMVFGRHQRILDRWLAGEISEEDIPGRRSGPSSRRRASSSAACSGSTASRAPRSASSASATAMPRRASSACSRAAGPPRWWR
jgi:hypothetical protein